MAFLPCSAHLCGIFTAAQFAHDVAIGAPLTLVFFEGDFLDGLRGRHDDVIADEETGCGRGRDTPHAVGPYGRSLQAAIAKHLHDGRGRGSGHATHRVKLREGDGIVSYDSPVAVVLIDRKVF